MAMLLTLTEEDIYRLYVAYQQDPKNYALIKQRIVGDGAKEEFRRNARPAILFMCGVAFITLATSLFSYAARHFDSMVAICIICFGVFIGFCVYMTIAYRRAFNITEKNESFFNKFEKVAEQAPTLSDFTKAWTP